MENKDKIIKAYDNMLMEIKELNKTNNDNPVMDSVIRIYHDQICLLKNKQKLDERKYTGLFIYKNIIDGLKNIDEKVSVVLTREQIEIIYKIVDSEYWYGFHHMITGKQIYETWLVFNAIKQKTIKDQERGCWYESK